MLRKLRRNIKRRLDNESGSISNKTVGVVSALLGSAMAVMVYTSEIHEIVDPASGGSIPVAAKNSISKNLDSLMQVPKSETTKESDKTASATLPENPVVPATAIAQEEIPLAVPFEKSEQNEPIITAQNPVVTKEDNETTKNNNVESTFIAIIPKEQPNHNPDVEKETIIPVKQSESSNPMGANASDASDKKQLGQMIPNPVITKEMIMPVKPSEKITPTVDSVADAKDKKQTNQVIPKPLVPKDTVVVTKQSPEKNEQGATDKQKIQTPLTSVPVQNINTSKTEDSEIKEDVISGQIKPSNFPVKDSAIDNDNTALIRIIPQETVKIIVEDRVNIDQTSITSSQLESLPNQLPEIKIISQPSQPEPQEFLPIVQKQKVVKSEIPPMKLNIEKANRELGRLSVRFEPIVTLPLQHTSLDNYPIEKRMVINNSFILQTAKSPASMYNVMDWSDGTESIKIDSRMQETGFASVDNTTAGDNISSANVTVVQIENGQYSYNGRYLITNSNAEVTMLPSATEHVQKEDLNTVTAIGTYMTIDWQRHLGCDFSVGFNGNSLIIHALDEKSTSLVHATNFVNNRPILTSSIIAAVKDMNVNIAEIQSISLYAD